MKYPLLDLFQDPFTSREKGGKKAAAGKAATAIEI